MENDKGEIVDLYVPRIRPRAGTLFCPIVCRPHGLIRDARDMP